MDPTCRWPLPELPRVYIAGRFTQTDRGFERESTTPHLIIHLFAVRASIRIGGETFAVEPGDLTITPADMPERFAMTGNGLHWAVRIVPVPALRQDGLVLPLHRHLGARAAEARRRIELIADDLRSSGGDPGHPGAHAAAAGAQALLCWIAALDRDTGPATSAEVCVDKATALLRSEAAASLPIPEVARRAGMSHNRLAAAFLRRHGISMVQYRNRTIIEQAKWYLETTELSLAGIRKRFDIVDAQAFNRRFKRVTGMSPRDWRARHAPAMVSSPRPAVPRRSTNATQDSPRSEFRGPRPARQPHT